MKKYLFFFIAVLTCCMTLQSCIVSEAATIPEVSVEYQYYDYMTNTVVVYVSGVAHYRYWDPLRSTYYYRVVPRERFGYIRRVPVRPRPSFRGRVPERRPGVGRGVPERRWTTPPSVPNRRSSNNINSSTRMTPRAGAGMGVSHSFGGRSGGGRR